MELGKVVLHYRVIEKIGHGGMGEVYRGEDLKLRRTVAIKVLPSGVVDSAAKLRLLREARSASALNHPNIVTIYAIEEADDAVFLVMEFIEGETLGSVIKRGRLPFPRLLDVAVQIASALGAAHEAGIVHRDLKPQNIIVTPQGRAKVLDFGVAKAIHNISGEMHSGMATVSANITDSGMISGTVAYMSPEQTRGELTEPSSDVFSLGSLLYEAATGQQPFRGPSLLSLMHEIASIAPVRLSTLNPDIPGEFELILRRAMAKDKRERYRDGTELANALTALRESDRGAVAPTMTEREQRSEDTPDVFVGRERDMQRLAERLRSTIEGRGKLVFITGEPGIGKSALVEHFVRSARRQHPSLPVCRGRCVEQYGTGEAYLPFLDALSDLLEGPARDRVLPVLRACAPTWCLQLPAAFAGSTGVEEQLRRETLGASKDRMMREFGDALAALSSSSAVVLVLEDLHWADPATVDLLRHLSRRIPAQNVMVLGTFRPEDLESGNHPLSKNLVEMQAHKECEEIPVGVLSAENLAGYLDLRYDPNDFPPEFPALLARKTDGHPLFAISLVHFLEERGDIANVNSRWGLSRPLSAMSLDVPEGVRSMIRKRIEALGEIDHRTLQYASVSGDEFLSTVLAKLLDTDDLELEERLGHIAKAHRLITVRGEEELPDGSLATRYSFAHALYQNVLYDELVSKRRVLLHRQAGEQMLAHYGARAPQIASQLAMHFEIGRDFARAVEYRTYAGDNATALFATAQADEHYTHALALTERLAAPERSEIEARLHQKRGNARFTQSLFDAAIADFTRWLEIAESMGAPQLQCDALNAIARTLFFAHRMTEFAARIQQVTELSESSNLENSRLETMALLAMKHSCFGELDSVKKIVEEAIPLASSAGNERILMRILPWRAQMHFFQSEYEAGEALFRRSIRLATDFSDSFMVMFSQFFLGLLLANVGRISEGLSTLMQINELARRNGDTFWSARLPNSIGWIYREVQDFDRALAYDREGAEVARRGQSMEAEANSVINIGFDHIEKRDGEDVMPLFADVESMIARDSWFRWRFSLRLHASQAEHYLRASDLDKALELATRLHELATRHQARKYVVVAHTLRARIAFSKHAFESALSELQLAIGLLSAYPAPLQAWKTYAVLGRVHAGMGNSEGARDAFAESSTIVERIASNIDDPALRSTFLNSAAIREVKDAIGVQAGGV